MSERSFQVLQIKHILILCERDLTVFSLKLLQFFRKTFSKPLIGLRVEYLYLIEG